MRHGFWNAGGLQDFGTKARAFPEFFLDPNKLIILCHPIASGQRTGLDLPAVDAHHKVRNKGVFRLSAAMGDDRGIPGLLGHVDG